MFVEKLLGQSIIIWRYGTNITPYFDYIENVGLQIPNLGWYSKNVGILRATHVLLQFSQPNQKLDCFFVSIDHEVNIFEAIEI